MKGEKVEYWSLEDLKAVAALKEKDIQVGNKFVRIKEISAWDMQQILDESAKMTERGTITSINLRKTMLLTLKYGLVQPDLSNLDEKEIANALKNLSYGDVVKIVTEINSLTGIRMTPEAEREAENLFRTKPL